MRLTQTVLTAPGRLAAGTRSVFPGLAVAVLIAMAATFVSDHHGGPTLLYALLIGMALHFLATGERSAAGVGFAGKTVLRLGVALLGARIGVEQLAALGLAPILLVLLGVAATIGFGILVAGLMGLGAERGVLTGGATAICGASAALAIAALLPRRPGHERDTLFAVVAVTTLSTIAMVTYPLLVTVLGLDDRAAGVFLGGTIHDVAQVVGAGYLVSVEAGDTATLTKLFRVAMLVPVCVVIAYWVARAATQDAVQPDGPLDTRERRPSLGLPWFLTAFIVLAACNSLGLIPPTAVDAMSDLSRWCLVTAIAAIGIKTALGDLREVGWRALVLVVLETLFLMAFVLTGLSILSM